MAEETPSRSTRVARNVYKYNEEEVATPLLGGISVEVGEVEGIVVDMLILVGELEVELEKWRWDQI